MENIKKLKILLQEEKYPYFDDDFLNVMLEENNNNVYKTASNLCLIKSDGDQKVTVGPITIEGPDASYWSNLAQQFLSMTNNNNNNDEDNSQTVGYKTSMKRG